MYEEYKSGREETPDELIEQLDYIYEFLEGLGVKIMSREGYEADDIIGTVKTALKDEFDSIYIVTADKDMGQLLDEKTYMMLPKKENGKYPELDIKGLEQKLNIRFEQIIDYYALIGDKVDSIPGVQGIGPKTAEKFLSMYSSIDEFFNKPEEWKSEKQRTLLLESREDIAKWKSLIRIKTDIDLVIEAEDLKLAAMNDDVVRRLSEKFNFHKFLQRTGNTKRESTDAESSAVEDILKSNELCILDIRGSYYILCSGKYAGIELSDIPGRIKDRKILVNDFKAMRILHNELASNEIYDISLIRDMQGRHSSVENMLREYTDMGAEFAEPDSIASAFASVFEHIAKDIIHGMNSDIYRQIEMPIIPVIARMEECGIKIDREFFKGQKAEYSEEIEELTEKIYEQAGRRFNINSPKQLSEVLFTDLNLKPLRKTKTGFSTDSSVLYQLSSQHEIADMILRYRELTKLVTGFIEPLMALADENDRIHTTFEQSYAITGRFSSKNPNMQNIPPVIREGFVPSGKDRIFLAVDYSQIELRIMAFLSKDPALLTAFENGRDIHNETAMRLFSVSEGKVNSEMRNIAKTVNFSVLYGKTPFGLAQDLNISRKEAAMFINRYFSEFAGVRTWIDATIEETRKKRGIGTLYGRWRDIPEINSQNKTVREAAERFAVNTPIQGTAADIMKIAIKNVHECMDDADNADMLLTIHDELLFEIGRGDSSKLIEKISKKMVDIKPFNDILEIKAIIGENWSQCK